MNSYLFIIGLVAAIILSIYPCFINNGKGKTKVSKFVFYNTIGESLDEKNISFQLLEKFPYKKFINNEDIDLINRATRIKQSYIWKGNIYGKLIFNNNDSCIIKISRYGSFFRNFENNLLYSFKKETDMESWQKLLNNFLSSKH